MPKFDWDDLHRLAHQIHRFPAQYHGICMACGGDFDEGDDVGYIDDELCCSPCCDDEERIN